MQYRHSKKNTFIYCHGHNNHNFSKMFGKLMLIQLMDFSANSYL